MGYRVIAMEAFGAQYLETAKVCKREVAHCDLFIGILGFFYGSSPPDSDLSFTELEYNAADLNTRPRLMFLGAEEMLVPASAREPDVKWDKQREFRKRVESAARPIGRFRTAVELVKLIRASLNEWERERIAKNATTGTDVCVVHPYPLSPLETDFVGRASERRQITDWFCRADDPIMIISGMGGTGKSALAWVWLQVEALRMPRPASDGFSRSAPESVLWWSFYESEAEFRLFLSRLLYLQGLNESIDPPDNAELAIGKLVARLTSRRCLIVLNGFERELKAYSQKGAADFRSCTSPLAGQFLLEFARSQGEAKLLMTSRLLPGELDDCTGVDVLELPEMNSEECERLFDTQKLKGSRRQFREAAKPYGRRPLFLRVLAGFARHDPEIGGNLGSKAWARLVSTDKYRCGNILQIAYNALSEDERSVLTLIALERKPVSFDAIINSSRTVSDTRLYQILRELMGRELLMFDREHQRYHMHSVVAEYVRDRARGTVEPRTLHDYCATIPAAQDARFSSLADLKPAIEIYLEDIFAERFDEACDVFRRHLQDPLYFWLADYGLQIDLLDRLFPDGWPSPRFISERNYGWALNALATCHSRLGNSGLALRLLSRSLDVSEAAQPSAGRILGLSNMAAEQLRQGQLKAAVGTLWQAVALGSEISERTPEGIARRELGLALSYVGQFAAAREQFDLAAPLLSKEEDRQSLGLLYARLSFWSILQHKTDDAMEYVTQARTVAADRVTERDIIRLEWLTAAAKVLLCLKDKTASAAGARILAEAEENLQGADKRARRIRLYDFLPDIYTAYGYLYVCQKNLPGAEEAAAKATSFAHEHGYRLNEAEAHLLFARIYREMGDATSVRDHVKECVVLATCDGDEFCYRPILNWCARFGTG